MPARAGQQRVPRDLSVVVGMDVDKAGSQNQPVGVDLTPGAARDLTDLDDFSIADRQPAAVHRSPGAVADLRVSDKQVVCHGPPPF